MDIIKNLFCDIHVIKKVKGMTFEIYGETHKKSNARYNKNQSVKN